MKGLPFVLLLAGCSSSPKYTVEDSSIAAVSMQEKQGVLAAQNDVNTAKAELESAKAQLRNCETELDVAENEYKSSKLQMDTAKLNQKSAELSGDMNKKNAANRDMHVAELGVKASDAKVEFLSKKKKWFKETEEAAELHVEAAQARYELEKAKLAQAKGIKPDEKFDVMNFETENMNKQQKWNEQRMEADKLKADVDARERQWQIQQQAYDQARSAAAQQTPR